MKKFFSKIFAPRLSPSDNIHFFKRLSFLLRAHIPLVVALSTIEGQSKPFLKKILGFIKADIIKGKHLSSSLSKYPDLFPTHSIYFIRAGEESGKLAEHLHILSDELERKKILRQKLIGSLIYPAMIAFGTLVLSIFLILVIFPKIKSLFKSLRVDLPLSTRIVIWLTDFFHTYGIIFFILLLVLLSTATFWIRHNKQARRRWNIFLLSLPFVGTSIKNYYIIMFFRTLGTMLQSSIPLDKALHHIEASTSHEEYKSAINIIAQNTMRGASFTSSLKSFPHLFSLNSCELIEVGETGGILAQVCNNISEMTEQDNENFIKNFLNILEPALMASLGLIVGFIALSMITPLYEITQNLKH